MSDITLLFHQRSLDMSYMFLNSRLNKKYAKYHTNPLCCIPTIILTCSTKGASMSKQNCLLQTQPNPRFHNRSDRLSFRKNMSEKITVSHKIAWYRFKLFLDQRVLQQQPTGKYRNVFGYPEKARKICHVLISYFFHKSNNFLFIALTLGPTKQQTW